MSFKRVKLNDIYIESFRKVQTLISGRNLADNFRWEDDEISKIEMPFVIYCERSAYNCDGFSAGGVGGGQTLKNRSVGMLVK